MTHTWKNEIEGKECSMLPSFPVSSHHEWFSTHGLCAHHLEG
jgi:hypothetical protein